MDVIAMTRGGFPETVAPLGTALTATQLAFLWKIAPEPVLCFDGDKAGIAAAHRVIDLALPLLVPGAVPAHRTAPRGPGSGRSSALRRRGGPRRRHRRGTAAVRGAVAPRLGGQ